MFVPLVVYHGGGDAAMFEPLASHQIEYEWALAQYLGELVLLYRLLAIVVIVCMIQMKPKHWLQNGLVSIRSIDPIVIRDIIHVSSCHSDSMHLIHTSVE